MIDVEGMKRELRATLQRVRDENAIEGKVRVIPIHMLLTQIEARAEGEPVEVEGSDNPTLPVPNSVTITESQADEAVAVWDDTMPDLTDMDVAGLLDAEPYDPDEEDE